MKKANIVKRVLSVLWWIAAVLLAILLINVLGAKARGEVPRIFGYSVMQIVTGSMEDTIPIGTYILVKQVEPEDIKEEDIISFYSDEKAILGLPNTHRVKEIIETENGIEFITRGDANPANDTVNAKAGKLIGVYVGSLDFLGDFTHFLNNGGMPAIFGALWIVTFAMIAYTFLKNREPRSDRKNGDGSE